MASILLGSGVAHLFLPPLRARRHEEARAGNEEVSQRFGGSGDAGHLLDSCVCSEGAR